MQDPRSPDPPAGARSRGARQVLLRNALVQPCSVPGRGPRGWRIDGGVYGPAGREIPLARHRFERAEFSLPPILRRDDLAPRPGRWLFGGWLQPTFGHYLVFSLGQLWPLAELAGKIDGVVFLGLAAGDVLEANPPLRDVLGCLGVGTRIPAILAREPMRFESLVVGQPIRLGVPGKPAWQSEAFMALVRRMAPPPARRDGLSLPGVYVSRSMLVNKGGFVLERLLEENLAREGYAIMRPEFLTVAQQMAVYAAARRVIFAEGTAVHLAVGGLDPATPVAVIARRRPMIPAVGWYLRGAGIERVAHLDAIRSVVTYAEGDLSVGGVRTLGMAVLDFERLRDGLVAAGLCTGEGWRIPDEAEVEAEVARVIAERRKAWPKRNFANLPIERLAPADPATAPG